MKRSISLSEYIMNLNENIISLIIQYKIHNSYITTLYSSQNLFLLNAVSKMIDKLKIEIIWNYQRKNYLDKNQVSSNSHSSISMHSPNTLEWQWNWEEWKNWKKIEIDKSDLIVSVVLQLISFYEQGYQFDDENWRFEKERNFDNCETIVGNEKNNKPLNCNWIHLY